jgi:transposase
MGDVSTQWVGLDVHKSSISIAILGPDGSVKVEKSIGTDARSVGGLLRELRALKRQGPVECVYEAGPTGYTLQRELTSVGLPCMVAAPSLIPRKPGDRVKTNRRDARKLATHLRAGLLTAVCPPSPQQEAIRDLCRCREDAREDLMRARHRLSKMLLRRGRIYREGSHWTKRHKLWLRGQRWELEGDRAAFESYHLAIEHLEERLEELERALETEAKKDPLREPVAWLRCFRGFDTLTAVTLVAELYEVARFGKPRQLMAYLGLVPSESSSGETRRQGSITKTGNSHLRRVLINAAWQYQRTVHLGRDLRKRREGQPPEILTLADRAMHRLRRRFVHLTLKRGKPAQKAVVSVARELAGFVWAVLVLYPQLQPSASRP